MWSKPRKLEIRYDQARIFSFVNFWQSKDVDNFKYVVEVQLVPSGLSQLGDIHQVILPRRLAHLGDSQRCRSHPIRMRGRG